MSDTDELVVDLMLAAEAQKQASEDAAKRLQDVLTSIEQVGRQVEQVAQEAASKAAGQATRDLRAGVEGAIERGTEIATDPMRRAASAALEASHTLDSIASTIHQRMWIMAGTAGFGACLAFIGAAYLLTPDLPAQRAELAAIQGQITAAQASLQVLHDKGGAMVWTTCQDHDQKPRRCIKADGRLGLMKAQDGTSYAVPLGY